MATTYNIEVREFNGIDYDILYPKTTMENVDGLANYSSFIVNLVECFKQAPNNIEYIESQYNILSGKVATESTKNPTMFYYIKGTEPTYTDGSLESLIPTIKMQ